MNVRRFLTGLLGLGVIAALLALDQWIFATWFRSMHLKWYLTAGASISFVSSIAAIAWGDMEKHTGLISPHPLDYMGACAQLLGLSVYALGVDIEGKQGGPRSPAIDVILGIPVMLALTGAVVVWLVVIAPPQYFVYLICGAPARLFPQAARQPIARQRGLHVDVEKIGIHDQIPAGWWSIGFSRRPVAVTGLFAALLFFIVKPLVLG